MQKEVSLTLIISIGIILFASTLVIIGDNTAGFAIKKNTCTDSDGGKKYDIPGFVTYNGNPNYKDGCSIFNKNTLKEFFCSSGKVRYVSYKCPNGCDKSTGACIQDSIKKTIVTVPFMYVYSENNVLASPISSGNVNLVNLGITPNTVLLDLSIVGVMGGLNCIKCPECCGGGTDIGVMGGLNCIKCPECCGGGSDLVFDNALTSKIQSTIIPAKYNNANYTCLDNKLFVAPTSCKSTTSWKNYAERVCKNRCDENRNCGIKILNIGNSCDSRKIYKR